jgi:hypothetical protein
VKQAFSKIALDPYYPLVAGYEWIYTDQLTGESLVYAIRRLSPTPAGGVVCFASAAGEESFFISRRCLYRSDEPSAPILRFPLRDGARWNYDDPDMGSVWCHVHGPEEIHTPAGRLRDCFRVEHRADGTAFLIEWYAWEVGLAKWVERHGDHHRSFALTGLACL